MSNYTLSDKVILIISPEPWNHLFVSKHHLAIELSKRGNVVVFANPPGKSFQIRTTKFENLIEMDYRNFFPGFSYFPKWIRCLLLSKVVNKMEGLVGVQFDIIWSFDNSVFYDFDALSEKKIRISHIVDLGQNFQTSKASKSADICLGVIPKIVDRHLLHNKNSFLIKHGVDLNSVSEEIVLPGENKRKVLYFGNLAMPHLNWNLLRMAVKSLPEVDFILLGSNHDFVPMDQNDNLHLLHPIDSSKLANYMKPCDALILFYSEDYLKSYASPHKMLEYLSSGKPIVSNKFEEFKVIDDLVYMSNENEEWIKFLEEALDESDLIKENQRKLVAQSNTYSKRIEEIEQIINSL